MEALSRLESQSTGHIYPLRVWLNPLALCNRFLSDPSRIMNIRHLIFAKIQFSTEFYFDVLGISRVKAGEKCVIGMPRDVILV